jgi:5'-3' exonuclease
MLLDSASMYYRAFYGVPDRFHSLDGTPVNAVRGFIDVIARLVTKFDPDWMVACWDDDWRPQFRVDLVPAYKAHRVAGLPAQPATTTASADRTVDSSNSDTEESIASSPVAPDPDGIQPAPVESVAPDREQSELEEEVPDDLERQVPIIIEVLRAFGIARVGSAGFEADDVISQFARDHNGPVDVVTGDRDLFQLVEPTRPTRVIYPARGFSNLEVVDDEWLLRKYRVAGVQYADFSLMRGDASDGLPGVRGVGEKTAASLIESYGTLTEILDAAADPGSSMSKAVRRKLLDSREYLSRADAVVRLSHSVPVPDLDPTLPMSPADPEALQDLTELHNLKSPVGRLTWALDGPRSG